MPEITRFYGIVIKIFFLREHNPPHFHAVYGEHNGIFEIDLPKKAQSLIVEWAGNYKAELMEMWNKKQLQKLPPLE